jgi:hypothetical protein
VILGKEKMLYSVSLIMKSVARLAAKESSSSPMDRWYQYVPQNKTSTVTEAANIFVLTDEIMQLLLLEDMGVKSRMPRVVCIVYS